MEEHNVRDRTGMFVDHVTVTKGFLFVQLEPVL